MTDHERLGKVLIVLTKSVIGLFTAALEIMAYGAVKFALETQGMVAGIVVTVIFLAIAMIAYAFLKPIRLSLLPEALIAVMGVFIIYLFFLLFISSQSAKEDIIMTISIIFIVTALLGINSRKEKSAPP